jgi:hypothetical protein
MFRKDLKKPEKLFNQEQALALLTEPIKDFEEDVLKYFDDKGARIWRRCAADAYYFKILAARGFERLGQSVSEFEHKIDLLKSAAFAYDKAAKDAALERWAMACFRCRIRASKLWGFLVKYGEQIPDYRDRDFFKNQYFFSTEFCLEDARWLGGIAQEEIRKREIAKRRPHSKQKI